MGIGDQLMAAGEAARLHRKTGKTVCICDRHGRPTWSPLWQGIPYIAQQRRPDCVTLMNASGTRPYIAQKTPKRWLWTPYAPEPAEYVVSSVEQRFAEPLRGLVMLEPHIKAQQHANKAWPWERWEDLAKQLRARGVRTVQCAAPGQRRLNSVHAFEITHDVRQAIAVLSVARAFIGTEGALHHAAAAVATPAVVLWSEFIAPNVTGYRTQINLRHAGPACGARLPCKGCAASMQALEVSEVLDAVLNLIGDE